MERGVGINIPQYCQCILNTVENLFDIHQGLISSTSSIHHRFISQFCFFIYLDHLCSLVVRVPGYTAEMCCASCEVRTEFMYVI
jgi:hypothetical protein